LAGEIPQQEVSILGLRFRNVLGVAAGFDKDVVVTPGLGMLGFGHIEIGTITPQPQAGNRRPRIFRLVEDGALINRMGFPSCGMEEATTRLRQISQSDRGYVIGVSLGKQKETPLTAAATDYQVVLESTYRYGDYFVINISSPNTPELRKLQGSQYLAELLRALMTKKEALARLNSVDKPLLVKIAPDLTLSELDDILKATMDAGIAGLIATNTTLNRDGLRSVYQTERGGLSGIPLGQQSTDMIRYISKRTEEKVPIIGVGGIATADDVKAKLDAGARLVQIYTALIYGGPGLPGRILRELQNKQTSPKPGPKI
jgi:dihydroorotate dehydrogenase